MKIRKLLIFVEKTCGYCIEDAMYICSMEGHVSRNKWKNVHTFVYTVLLSDYILFGSYYIKGIVHWRAGEAFTAEVHFQRKIILNNAI